MRIHRSAHTRFFTTLGNEVLRDNRLSFCARGILAYLLSLPDGHRADIRTLAERAPEGRDRVASALRELERFGYLTRTVKRGADGRLFTQVDVLDAPGGGPESSQVTPSAEFPGVGGEVADPGDDHPVKERDEETTRPDDDDDDDADASPRADDGREGADRADTNASAQLLARVARTEPKLAVGRAEALRLAPLVAEWRRRGASDLRIINSLTAGLPRCGVHHPARFIETRLVTKMPPERRTSPTSFECAECGVPVPAPGSCRSCLRLDAAADRPAIDFAQVRARGAALARAALRGLTLDAAAPAVA